jgi:uncharacterized protein YecE (DUF72 family)
MSTLRIGTSGWNYPSGKGAWTGIFYPAKGAAPKGFDELGFYAARFNTVEVNSTFYGQPRANVSLGWVKRTPPGFEFAVKLYQKFTHPNLVADKTVQGRYRAARGRGATGTAARAVSGELQGQP